MFQLLLCRYVVPVNGKEELTDGDEDVEPGGERITPTGDVYGFIEYDTLHYTHQKPWEVCDQKNKS